MNEATHTYTAIIVDDNDVDRLHTQVMVKKYPFIEIKGVYDNPLEAYTAIEEQKPDILFLDIDMEDMTGLELRRKLGNQQACIYITSYPDYALESFELAALDFLVKPINKARFDMTMERLQQYLDIKHKAALFECSLGQDAVFIKDGHEHIKLQLQDILYLEALRDYTRIVTPAKKYCVLNLLGNLLQEAAFKTFVRIHRSYAVQKHYIHKITSTEVYVNEITLPVGRSYKTAVESLLHH
ncbi:LytR/AlgR family response regulator transcription factor [Terrimonas rubra]|uniref:LytR/AlgR family response regulator transcription factor n=1 Tax=Terrimonas rubra TaxID=1035890 RepID=A0ABW6A8X1_9BACT